MHFGRSHSEHTPTPRLERRIMGLKWGQCMLLLAPWCWAYLALSKVADGVFPMAPNPTPTAKPSANKTQSRRAGVRWICLLDKLTKQSEKQELLLVYPQNIHGGRGLVCREYSTFILYLNVTIGNYSKGPECTSSPLTSHEYHLKCPSSRMEKVTWRVMYSRVWQITDSKAVSGLIPCRQKPFFLLQPHCLSGVRRWASKGD